MIDTDTIGTADAAAILHLTQGRVRQLVQAGDLRAERLADRLVLSRAEIEAFAKIDRPCGPRRKNKTT